MLIRPCVDNPVLAQLSTRREGTVCLEVNWLQVLTVVQLAEHPTNVSVFFSGLLIALFCSPVPQSLCFSEEFLAADAFAIRFGCGVYVFEFHFVATGKLLKSIAHRLDKRP